MENAIYDERMEKTMLNIWLYSLNEQFDDIQWFLFWAIQSDCLLRKAFYALDSTALCVRNLQLHRKCHIHTFANEDSVHNRWHLWKYAMNKFALLHRCSYKMYSTVDKNEERIFIEYFDKIIRFKLLNGSENVWENEFCIRKLLKK